MCGITGIIDFDAVAVDRDLLQNMTDALMTRGPDAEGFAYSTHIGLGHRRLSIIDVTGGVQPMSSPDGRYTIVFNGEIYNFLELRESLEKTGIHFRTHSDTEVLLHLFAREGANCLEKLNGMFAFAIWDAKDKKLFAARDRMGKKPFYYALRGNKLLFASELKALLKHPLIARALNPEAIKLFLTYEYIPAPFSAIQDVLKLPAAHFLEWSGKSICVTRYWNQPFDEPLEIDERSASKKLLELLERAVSLRLISDVPLGVFLSGGVDSSSVVALMARQRPGKDIKTFSINFKEASYDESFYSATIAKTFGTDHHEEVLSADKMLTILPEVASYLDEPFADGSVLPTYLLSRFTRQHVTVALGGDGADELFAGYPTFFASRLANAYARLPAFMKRAISKTANFLPTSEHNMSLDFKARQFLAGADFGGVMKNQIWLAALTPTDLAGILTPNFTQKTKIDPLELIYAEMKNCSSPHFGDQLLYFYQKFYLADGILTKVDRASMANSLEVRAPYLDKDVVEFATRLPYAYKLKGVTTKYIVKKAFNRILPAMITQRSKKGFGIPVAGWLKAELKPLLLNTLSRTRINRDGIFQWPVIEKLIGEHMSGKRNHRKPLFALLMLHQWLENFNITLG
jgi:asparagine synthase (glutamine-hydrolysing)